MKVAGIMSGTSLDGIDVAVVEITGLRRIRTVAFRSTPYPAKLREALLAVSNTNCHTADIARLHFVLPEFYAKAVEAVGEKVDLVGCHGQTIFHEGQARKMFGHAVVSTLQIGDGSVLAERLGVPVVSDFRAADIAAGGQGAPLVPFVDYLLYRDRRRNRVSLNIGGIANITVIPAGARPEQVVAFDTGPGNMVLDQLAQIATGGKARFDRDGRLSSKGTLNRKLLDELLKDAYYRKAAPKSAGREQYGREFIEGLMKSKLPLVDLMATAAGLTAATIAQAVGTTDDLIVSGGGIHNPRIMGYLAAFLPGVRIMSSQEFGIDPDAKEAIAFAVMAYQTWHGRTSNLPSATGARKAKILGGLYR